MKRFRSLFLPIFFGLIMGGCASDGKISEKGSHTSSDSNMESAETGSPSSGRAAVSSSTNKPGSSKSMDRPGSEYEDEDTLDACLARVPKDASEGQKLLAEQTCRRDYANRPFRR